MRIKNRLLTATLYTYVQPVNQKRAHTKGKKWGSFSNYINWLIAKDHGDKTSMKASTDMQKIFFTVSPNARPKKKKAKAKKAKGKAKRVKTRTQRSKPLTVSSKRKKTTTPKVATKKVASKRSQRRTSQQKKPGLIGKVLKLASKKTHATNNSVAA